MENMEGNKIQLELTKENNKAYDIAIFLVNSLKLTFEKYFSDCENERKNISLNYIFDHINIKQVWKKDRSFRLDLIDDSLNYYTDLRNYFLASLHFIDKKNLFKIPKIKEKIKSKFSIYYLSILLELLLKILKDNPDAHKDNIIKFDISVICELFRDKNLRLTSSHTFFYCCVKELCEKYNLDIPMKNDFRANNFKIYKDKAIELLTKEKKNFVNYIKGNLDQAYGILEEKKQTIINSNKIDYKKFEEIEAKIEKLTRLENNIQSIDNIRDNKNNIEIKNYLREYAENYAQKKGFKIEPAKTEYINFLLDNCLFPIKILDINEEDEDNILIISSLEYKEIKQFWEKGESFYEKYLEAKEEIDYVKENTYENEIKTILEDDKFLKNFFTILCSKSVTSYLKSVIKYENEDEFSYGTKITEISDNIDENSLFDLESKGDIYLGRQFKEFINNYKDNYNKFRKLIIIKELGYKIPSCTGPSMRIFINPKLHFSKEALENEKQKNSILISALIIILIHEITHLLKYYPINNKYPEEYPKTPKNKENGKCLIFYLFNKEIIDKINSTQSSQVNSIENWNNIDKLKSIFQSDDNKNISIKEKEGELDLFSSHIQKSELVKNRKIRFINDYCWW